MRRASVVIGGGLLAACTVWLSGAVAEEATRVPAFAYADHLVLPVRLHILRAEKLPDIQCDLSPEESLQIVEGVNRIWAQAGIQFYPEAVVREDAIEQNRFELARELGVMSLGLHLILRPEQSMTPDRLHVYFVKKLPVNGVQLEDHVAFVRETPRLRGTAGDALAGRARVMAHELGHTLSLEHAGEDQWLMSSGASGTLLGPEEVREARRYAGNLNWHESISLCARTAAQELEAGRWESARRRYGILAAIAGESAIKEEARQALWRIERLVDMQAAQ